MSFHKQRAIFPVKTVSNLKNLPPGLIKRDEAYLNSAWKTITNAGFQNRFKKGLMGLDFRRQEGKKISISSTSSLRNRWCGILR